MIALQPFASLAQTAADASAVSAKAPKDLIAAAEPFYNFSDPSLKPWHLKATYQLYDEKGEPGEQGTFEYWWASPTLYRSSWTRQSATHSYWHTAESKRAYQKTGEALQYSEFKLRSAFFSPLPTESEMDPTKYRLEKQTVSMGGGKLNCAMVSPLTPQPGKISEVQMGLFPTYCFDSKGPIVRISYSLGSVTTEFNKIVIVQNHYLAKEIIFFEGKRKILSATVDSLTTLDPADAALIPPAAAPITDDKPVKIEGGLAQGSLLKKTYPVYPEDAKQQHIQGKVVLHAIIGMDGGIHELQVISTPWPSLAASALWTVSHWQYKPYMLNGQPVEIQTTINVVFTLN